METILPFFVIIPLIGFLFSVSMTGTRETRVFGVALVTLSTHLLLSVGFLVTWLYRGHPVLNLRSLELINTGEYQFFLDFYFDRITAVYQLVGAFLTLLVVLYSRYYLHRERGFSRFFSTTLFFYLGYCLTVVAGNLETMFIGWEILGISSFLLIAFYRSRYLPVKNALKVFSVYRIADVGLLIAMWQSHHLWHANITFSALSNDPLIQRQLLTHGSIGVFISMMIVLSASAKSAQLPFSSWLPRAMEGPTPSSAIFYGSLSVHIGVFLLLRTAPFWEHQPSVRIVIGLIGLLTSLVSTGIARVQSSVKSQVAYASIAQIGLIFMEVAAGWYNLALYHFACNAFLRTYQLLISPSVVTYLIREQFYGLAAVPTGYTRLLPKRLADTLYVLNLKEWSLDAGQYQLLWQPVKWIGHRLDFLSPAWVFGLGLPVYGLGLVGAFHQDNLLPVWRDYLPIGFSLIGLVLVMRSFTKRKNVYLSWLLIVLNHFWIALAIAFNEPFGFGQVHLYLSGVVIAGLWGYACLYNLQSHEGPLDLNQYAGYSHPHPRLAFGFLGCCLALAGFPISPTFIGEDLMFSHIHQHQLVLASLVAFSFILNGLAVVRMYARLFLGPWPNSPAGTAYRSS